MHAEEAQQSEVFDRAAELFGVLSTPVRLRIISELCNCEKRVGQLLGNIKVAQPNLSQHLNMLYRAGVVAKRRHGAQVFYRIADESVALVSRAVCNRVAGEMDGVIGIPVTGRRNQFLIPGQSNVDGRSLREL